MLEVTARGLEPPSSEPESDILSVELRSRFDLVCFTYDCGA